MRYRSYGRSEVSVSTLTLNLQSIPGKSRAADWRGMVFAALESGINAFEVNPGVAPGVMAGLGEALESIERRLCFVTLRCTVAVDSLSSHAVLRQAAECAERIGLERFDCVMLEGPGLDALSSSDLQAVSELRAIADHVGMAGGAALDPLALRGVIDAVAVEYNITSPVQTRNRIRNLSAAGVAVLIDEPCPDTLLQPPPPPQRRGFFRKPVPAPTGGYDFLHNTVGWTAEQVCVGYTLTEPGVTSIRVTASDAKRLASLAAVTDKDVPASMGAQVEMARFAATQPEQARARRA